MLTVDYTWTSSGPDDMDVFAFAPDGHDLYVLNEMRITVTAFKYASGRLTEFQTVSALPAATAPTAADSGAEIAVHPDGRHVYASLRGPDSVAVFARDLATGRLELVEHAATGGHTPRSFAIDPTGRWLLAASLRQAGRPPHRHPAGACAPAEGQGPRRGPGKRET